MTMSLPPDDDAAVPGEGDRGGLDLLLSVAASGERPDGGAVGATSPSPASSPSPSPSPSPALDASRNGSVPHKLVAILSDPSHASIITWLARGDAFVILDPDRFATDVLPKHFRRVADFRSFRRKLNRYGFKTVKRSVVRAAVGAAKARDARAFEHEYFRRGRPDLLEKIVCRSKPVACRSGPKTPASETLSEVAGAVPAEATPSPPAPEEGAAEMEQRLLMLEARRRMQGPPATAEAVPSAPSPVESVAEMERRLLMLEAQRRMDGAYAAAQATLSPPVSEESATEIEHRLLILEARRRMHGAYATAIAVPSPPAPEESAEEIEHRLLILEARRRMHGARAAVQATREGVAEMERGLLMREVARAPAPGETVAEIECRFLIRRIAMLESWRRTHRALLRLPPAGVGAAL